MNLPIKLTNKIIIEQYNINSDEFDGDGRVWQQKCCVYAHIQSLFNQRQVGNEVALAKKIVSTNFFQFTIRYRTDLKSNMRIIFDQQIYNIVKIISDLSSKKYLRLIAEETQE